ncbi:MAG: hypothetical protein ACT4OK_00915 [Gemmobacter sp.]
MNENVENLILVQMREMRAEMAAMRGDLADVKRDVAGLRTDVRSEMADVNQKVDGLSLMMTMLMGHVAHLGERVESLEEKVH